MQLLDDELGGIVFVAGVSEMAHDAAGGLTDLVAGDTAIKDPISQLLRHPNPRHRRHAHPAPRVALVLRRPGSEIWVAKQHHRGDFVLRDVLTSQGLCLDHGALGIPKQDEEGLGTLGELGGDESDLGLSAPGDGGGIFGGGRVLEFLFSAAGDGRQDVLVDGIIGYGSAPHFASPSSTNHVVRWTPGVSGTSREFLFAS